jgi:hypothetical protein
MLTMSAEFGNRIEQADRTISETGTIVRSNCGRKAGRKFQSQQPDKAPAYANREDISDCSRAFARGKWNSSG